MDDSKMLKEIDKIVKSFNKIYFDEALGEYIDWKIKKEGE